MPCPTYLASSHACIVIEAEERLPQRFVNVCIDDRRFVLCTLTSEPLIAGTMLLHTHDTAMGGVAGYRR
jgi:hypothetical protein